MAGCGNSRLSEDMFEDGYANLSNIDISRVVIDQMSDKYKDKPALTFQQMNVCSLEFPDESFDAVVAKGVMDAILCGEGSTANVAKMRGGRAALENRRGDAAAPAGIRPRGRAAATPRLRRGVVRGAEPCKRPRESSETDVVAPSSVRALRCMEVSRVLKPAGVFFVVSYGVPDNRMQYLENEDYSWTVTTHTVPKPTVSATAVPDTKDANSVHYIYVCAKGGNAEEG